MVVMVVTMVVGYLVEWGFGRNGGGGSDDYEIHGIHGIPCAFLEVMVGMVV